MVRNTTYLLAATFMVTLPFITRTFLYKTHQNVNSNNYYKILELQKENNVLKNKYYISTVEDNNVELSKNLNKNYVDILNGFYLLPNIFVNRNLSNFGLEDYLKYNYNKKYNNFIFHSNWEETLWKKENNYFIYELAGLETIKLNNIEIINLFKNEIFNKLPKININSIFIKLNKPVWNIKEFSEKEIKAIQIFLGKKNKNIQYLRRDFELIIKNNNQLRNNLINEFGDDFYKMVNLLFFDRPIFMEQNIKNKNSLLFIQNAIPENNTINMEEKITYKDEEFIKNQMVIFLNNNEISILNNDLERFKIQIDRFNNVFSNINNQNEWINYVSENSYKFRNILKLLEDLQSLSSNDNTIYSLNLSPNSNITKNYKYSLNFKTEYINKNDFSFTVVGFTVLFSLIIYLINKSKSKEI
ncbi:hypothetical protein [Mycoplasma enhydrae]|uniref:hypothetical protein n=1 Tax=Mycoplasma enhydrae TaxID=2499220 RepID=UPI00197C2E02|nr:hypothetical protein [Mycoplasma enhydrae]MBN4089690.1 hypothetical protein [Mycoplasma enhydrae]